MDDGFTKFLIAREDQLLNEWLEPFDNDKVLNLGCGEGRFMEHADFGIDHNEEIIEAAQKKYPNLDFIVADATQTNFPDVSFDVVFSLHMFTEMDKENIKIIFKEVHRILRPKGRFIFNISSYRYHKTSGFSVGEIKELFQEGWDLVHEEGLIFLPIKNIPQKIHPYFFRLDQFLCRTFASDYANFILVVMEKQD